MTSWYWGLQSDLKMKEMGLVRLMVMMTTMTVILMMMMKLHLMSDRWKLG